MDLSILSTNLRRLRTASGKSQGELAELSGLSRVGYRSIEAGQVAPRVDSLMRVAGALGVGIEQLLAPARTLSQVRFRAQKKMHSRDDLLVRVARKLDDYNDLERLLDRSTAFVFAPVRKELGRKKPGPLRAKASALVARKVVGIQDDELIRDICGLLKDHGVKVLTPKVASEGFFGLSIADADGGPAVVVNTWDRISVERWIFTAAHELGHLLLHLGSYDVAETDENKEEESEADVFAGYFLVPETTFAAELANSRGLPLVDRVFKLKRIFRVSYRTVLYRMGEHLAAAERQKLWIRFQADFKRRSCRGLSRASEPDGLPPEAFHGSPPDRGADEPERLLPSDFVEDRLYRLVREAVEKEAITLSRAAEILGIGVEEMRDLTASWAE